MARNTSNTARSRALGAAMRRLREEYYEGTLRAFAKENGFDPSALSRWETGQTIPDSERVGVFAGALKLPAQERDTLIEAAKKASDPNWVAPGVDQQVSELMDFERTAHRMTCVSPLLVPGLLQTEAYARAIVGRGNRTEAQIKAKVNARMVRKEALFRSAPLQFEAFLGMPVVTGRRIGGVPVLAEQLRYILKMGDLGHVAIHVVPDDSDGFDPSLGGPFILYEFEAGTPPVCYFEHHRSSMFSSNKDAKEMRDALEEIKEVAMSPACSAGLIADVIKEMETTA